MYKLDATGSRRFCYDTGSMWEITETDKSYTFKRASKVTDYDCLPDKFKLRKDGNNRHALRVWDWGDYTMYFDCDGQPLVFEKQER